MKKKDQIALLKMQKDRLIADHEDQAETLANVREIAGRQRDRLLTQENLILGLLDLSREKEIEIEELESACDNKHDTIDRLNKERDARTGATEELLCGKDDEVACLNAQLGELEKALRSRIQELEAQHVLDAVNKSRDAIAIEGLRKEIETRERDNLNRLKLLRSEAIELCRRLNYFGFGEENVSIVKLAENIQTRANVLCKSQS